MRNWILASGLAAALLSGSSGTWAAEANVVMQAIGKNGLGDPVGKIHMIDDPKGLMMHIDLQDLPPGPNSFYSYDAENCKLTLGDLLVSRLTVLNVDITEDGAEPLTTKATFPGLTVEDVLGQVLIIDKGDLFESQQAGQPLSALSVACGVVQ